MKDRFKQIDLIQKCHTNESYYKYKKHERDADCISGHFLMRICCKVNYEIKKVKTKYEGEIRKILQKGEGVHRLKNSGKQTKTITEEINKRIISSKK